MAGGGEEVGKVFVTIEAQGAENVAKEVNRAKAMASVPVAGLLNSQAATAGSGYDIASGAYDLASGPAGPNAPKRNVTPFPLMSMAGGGVGPIKENTDAIKKQKAAADELTKAFDNLDAIHTRLAESKKNLRQQMVGLRQGIFGTVSIIGAFVTGIGAAIQGAIGFSNASRDVSNALRDIDEGLKITTTVGQSSFETLSKSATDYHETVKRGLDLEKTANDELITAILDNQKIRVDISSEGIKTQLANSALATAKEIQNDAALEKNKEKILVLERNQADFRIRNIERESELKSTSSEKEQMNLKRKFELEDARRNRAVAEEGEVLPQDLVDRYEKEEELINKKYDNEISRAEEVKKMKDFNEAAASSIDATRKAELAELDGVAKIRKQRDFDIEDLQKKKSVIEDKDTRELIDKQIAAREQIAAKDMQIFEKSEAEKDKLKREVADREIERATEVAQRSAQAFADAWKSAQRSLLDTNAGTSKSMLQLLTKVEHIAKSLGRMG